MVGQPPQLREYPRGNAPLATVSSSGQWGRFVVYGTGGLNYRTPRFLIIKQVAWELDAQRPSKGLARSLNDLFRKALQVRGDARTLKAADEYAPQRRLTL